MSGVSILKEDLTFLSLSPVTPCVTPYFHVETVSMSYISGHLFCTRIEGKNGDISFSATKMYTILSDTDMQLIVLRNVLSHYLVCANRMK